MRYLKSLTPLFLLAALLAAVAMACSTPTPTEPVERSADRDRGSAPTPEIEAAPSTDIERQRFADTARDPFTRPGIDDGRSTVDRTGPMECDPEEEPMGLANPRNLTLLGLVTGTAVPRAMFLVGGDTTAILATEGARVGPNCSQRILEIRDNEVVISPFGADDDPRQQTIIVLSEEGVDADVTESN